MKFAAVYTTETMFKSLSIFQRFGYVRCSGLKRVMGGLISLEKVMGVPVLFEEI